MERYRFHTDGALFYVTFSVVDWLPIFVSEAACKIVTESLNFCHRQKGLRINAYMIMPTHLHAVLFHADFQAKALEQVVTDFRKFTGPPAGRLLRPTYAGLLSGRARGTCWRGPPKAAVAADAASGANRDGGFLAGE